MSLLDSIVKELKELPPPKLVAVSNYIHSLNPASESTNHRRAALRATSGCMPGEEGEDFERAVREAADHVDADE